MVVIMIMVEVKVGVMVMVMVVAVVTITVKMVANECVRVLKFGGCRCRAVIKLSGITI
jgi:hypothetical protein